MTPPTSATCAYCNETIAMTVPGAGLVITVSSGHDGSHGLQELYAHRRCFIEHLHLTFPLGQALDPFNG
jgi:hypothetical protein